MAKKKKKHPPQQQQNKRKRKRMSFSQIVFYGLGLLVIISMLVSTINL